MLYSTYKATCRRNGAFSGASGPKDLNAELVDPILKHVATTWARVFQSRLPASIEACFKDVCVIVNNFHHDAVSGLQDPSANQKGIEMLHQQLPSRMTAVENYRASTCDFITASQRDANRGFVPVVKEAMTPAYNTCVAERGQFFPWARRHCQCCRDVRTKPQFQQSLSSVDIHHQHAKRQY